MNKNVKNVFVGVLLFIVGIVVLVAVILLINWIRNGVKLYNDIGATPFYRPETEISADKSDVYSDNDIQLALETVKTDFENNYEDGYGGMYLLKIWYDDEFSNGYISCYEKSCDGQTKPRIYIRAHLYAGFKEDGTGWGSFSLYTAGYWTLERNDENSQWESLGWGQG